MCLTRLRMLHHQRREPALAMPCCLWCRPDTFSLGVCTGCRLLHPLPLIRAMSQCCVCGADLSLVSVECRPNTFSLGVCNGCQLMALLGWVPGGGLEDVQQPRFVHNASGRFECRWATVAIQPSPSLLLKVSLHQPNAVISHLQGLSAVRITKGS